MRYLLLLEDGNLRQTTEEPDEDTLAEIESGALEVLKFENDVFSYAAVKVETDEDGDDTFVLEGWRPVQEA